MMFLFFFNDTATTEIYTLSLHDALPIFLFIEVALMPGKGQLILTGQLGDVMKESCQAAMSYIRSRAKELGLSEKFYRSEEHTSELQSRQYLVCRLLLEKKKKLTLLSTYR